MVDIVGKKTLFHEIWNNVLMKNVKFINETQVNHTQILYIHKKNNSKNENEKKKQPNKQIIFLLEKFQERKIPPRLIISLVCSRF